MRTLSSTLQAAQQSTSAQPFVKVEVLDMLAGVVRPTFTRHYTGSEEDFHHAVTMPGDGSLVRARVDSTTKDLFVQRVPNPGPSSDFSSWTSLDTIGVGCNIALCSQGSSVLLFFVDELDGHTLRYRESSDNGATWSARKLVFVPTANLVKWLAAAFGPSGVPALFFASDEPTIYVTKRVSGQWSTEASWSNSVSTVTGLACTYQTDWNLALTGTNSNSDYRLWTFIYGDGGEQTAGTWSALQEVGQANGDSDIELHVPFLIVPDVSRLSYIEKYTGASTFQRPHLLNTLVGTTFGQVSWREPIPFDLDTSKGLAQAAGGGSLWLSIPSGVWSGSLSQVSVDLSGDVIAIAGREEPQGGRISITLRNDDGRYGTLGQGTNAAVRLSSEVQVSPGYVTSAGTEVSSGPAFWITGWEYLSQGGRASFVLHAADGWWLLAGWHARRQYSWATGAKSVLDILRFVLERVGLSLNAPSPSSTITTHKPEITISPGESGATVVRRLLALIPDRLFFRGQAAHLREPQKSDATDYAYGTSHPLLEAHYGQGPLGYTRVQVFGAAGMEETFVWGEMPLLGERVLQQHDLNLDTQQKASDRCQEIVRSLELEALFGETTVPVNCGQELYDLVEITDSRAGLSAAKRRVAGLRLEYRRDGPPRYLLHLALGGV